MRIRGGVIALCFLSAGLAQAADKELRLSLPSDSPGWADITDMAQQFFPASSGATVDIDQAGGIVTVHNAPPAQAEIFGGILQKLQSTLTTLYAVRLTITDNAGRHVDKTCVAQTWAPCRIELSDDHEAGQGNKPVVGLTAIFRVRQADASGNLLFNYEITDSRVDHNAALTRPKTEAAAERVVRPGLEVELASVGSSGASTKYRAVAAGLTPLSTNIPLPHATRGSPGQVVFDTAICSRQFVTSAVPTPADGPVSAAGVLIADGIIATRYMDLDACPADAPRFEYVSASQYLYP